MGRFQNSWAITKQSWAVLRSNPSLAIFPVLSGLATLFVAASFLGPLVVLFLNGKGLDAAFRHNHNVEPIYYLLGFAFYAMTSFVIIFFNAALVSCAYQNLLGKPATVADGLRNAAQHLPKIIGWSLISATVGQVIKALQQRGGLAGAIAGGLAGLAWTLAIFFVIPLMVIENLGPIAALKMSANRLRATWGERLLLHASLGFAGFLLVILPAIALIVGGIILAASNMLYTGATVAIFGIFYLVAGGVVFSAMTMIYQTALYLYTSNGTISNWYRPQSIQGAFVQKSAPRGPGFP